MALKYNHLERRKHTFYFRYWIKKIKERPITPRLAFQIRTYPDADRTLDFPDKKKAK